jgi:hypothetical protein
VRAKKALARDEAMLAAFIACVDRLDAWVNVMEGHGSPPESASGDAQALLSRFGQASGSASEKILSDWLAALLARGFATTALDPAHAHSNRTGAQTAQ